MAYSQVLRWSTGFVGLRHTNWRFGLDDDNLCRLCEEEQEDVPHILAECPSLMWLRRQTLGEFQIQGDSFEWPSDRLLAFLKQPAIRALENCGDEFLILFYEEYDRFRDLVDHIEEEQELNSSSEEKRDS